MYVQWKVSWCAKKVSHKVKWCYGYFYTEMTCSFYTIPSHLTMHIFPFPIPFRHQTHTVPHIEIWSKSPLLDKPYKIWVDVGSNHVLVICTFLVFMSRQIFWPKSLHISRNHSWNSVNIEWHLWYMIMPLNVPLSMHLSNDILWLKGGCIHSSMTSLLSFLFAYHALLLSKGKKPFSLLLKGQNGLASYLSDYSPDRSLR